MPNFEERSGSNAAQQAENQFQDKILSKGLTLQNPRDAGLILPARAPWLFLPILSTFTTKSSDGPTDLIDEIQRFLDLLEQLPLSLNVPPQTVSYRYAKSTTTQETLSGFVQWHWGDELDTVDVSAATGSFINKDTGLAVGRDRRATYSYVNFDNLLSLYRNNGAIYDSFGKVVVFNGLTMINDLGVYTGYFKNFSWTETSNAPYNLSFNFSFRVERVVHIFADLG